MQVIVGDVLRQRRERVDFAGQAALHPAHSWRSVFTQFLGEADERSPGVPADPREQHSERQDDDAQRSRKPGRAPGDAPPAS
jgi:hypothetical protein